MHNKITGDAMIGAEAAADPPAEVPIWIPRAELWRFLLVTFAVGMALQLVAVGVGLKTGGMVWLGLTMWAPTLGALLAGPRSRAAAWRATRRISWRWVPVGLVVGFAPRLIQTVVLAVTGLGTWQSETFVLTADGGAIASIHGVATALGFGPQSFAFLALNLALTLVLSAVLVAIIGGIGEEIGWRGVLQPALEQRFGFWRGTFFVGLLWASWHLPANLSGYNDPEHPILGAVLFFPIVVVVMSFALASLRWRSASVWPVAVAHGANNTLSHSFLFETTDWWTSTILEITSIVLVAVVVTVWARSKGADVAGARA